MQTPTPKHYQRMGFLCSLGSIVCLQFVHLSCTAFPVPFTRHPFLPVPSAPVFTKMIFIQEPEW